MRTKRPKKYLSNLAIKGQTSSQLTPQLQEGEINRKIKQDDMTVMTIGGNDLFQGGEILESLSLNQIDQSKEKYLKNPLHSKTSKKIMEISLEKGINLIVGQRVVK